MKPAKQPAGSPGLSKTEDGTRTHEPHQTRKPPARRPRDPDSRSRQNRETARFPIRITADLQSKIGKRETGNHPKETGKRVIRFPMPDWPGIGIRKWAISRSVSRERVR